MAVPTRATLVHEEFAFTSSVVQGEGITRSLLSRDEGSTATFDESGETTLKCTESCGRTFDVRLTTPKEQTKQRWGYAKKRVIYLAIAYLLIILTGPMATYLHGVLRVMGLVIAAGAGIFTVTQFLVPLKPIDKYTLVSHDGAKPSVDDVVHEVQLR